MLTLLRTSTSTSAALRRLAAPAGSRGVSSISEQAPERPSAGGEFRRKHAQTAGKSRGGMVAERAVVPGGPGADRVATSKPPPNVPRWQSPNMPTIWSPNQNPRQNAMRGPRFEQTNMELQPTPLSAMQLISEEPIRLVEQRIASCDGGGGPLGHPKVFINVDKPGPKACGYCGLRFERLDDHHAHH